MQKTNNLQEIFLTQVRRDRRPVTMFLMNGYQMRGYVTGFDAFTVVLSSDGKQMVTSTPSPPSCLSAPWRCASPGRSETSPPRDMRRAARPALRPGIYELCLRPAGPELMDPTDFKRKRELP